MKYTALMETATATVSRCSECGTPVHERRVPAPAAWFHRRKTLPVASVIVASIVCAVQFECSLEGGGP